MAWSLLAPIALAVLLGAISFGHGIAGASTLASGSTPPSTDYLGGLSVSGYCSAHGYGPGTLNPKGGGIGTNFAYDNWECDGSGVLSMQALCVWQYPQSNPDDQVVAYTDEPDNADSWTCYLVMINSSVAPIAASLSTPGEDFHSVGHDLENAGITVALLLFLVFPSSIFNNTFSAHYDEIMTRFSRIRGRGHRLFGLRDDASVALAAVVTPVAVGPPEVPVPIDATTATEPVAEPATSEVPSLAAPTPAPATPGRASRFTFGLVLVIGAILGGLLSPKFGLNGGSIEDVLATLGSFAFGAVVSWYVALRFRRWHHYPTETYLKALPFGLGVAALCVIISRVSDFQPGYLYGVVVGISFASTLADRHNAHLVAISTLSTLAVALSAWILWIPVNHLATEPGSFFLLVIIDDVLASIFIGGLIGSVISLLPLINMPGHQLVTWRRDAWFAVYALTVFLMLQVELNPESGPTHPGAAPWVTALVLFVFFGGSTMLMRWYFNRAAVAAPAVAAPPTPPPLEGETAGSDDGGAVS